MGKINHLKINSKDAVTWRERRRTETFGFGCLTLVTLHPPSKVLVSTATATRETGNNQQGRQAMTPQHFKTREEPYALGHCQSPARCCMFPPVGNPRPIPLGPPRGMKPPRSPPRPMPPRPIIPKGTKTAVLEHQTLQRLPTHPMMCQSLGSRTMFI